MKSLSKVASILLLCAMMVSFVPAAMTVSAAPAAQSCTDRAQFVSDVTVPDGTRYEPGAAFTKTWRLRNVGTCTWTSSYSLVFESGNAMGNTTSVPFAVTANVPPGATIDVSIPLSAPATAGHYIGYWKFKNPSGVLFGIGTAANKAWWVEINVTSSAPGGSVLLDFTASAKDAAWASGAGTLTFNGTDGDAKGFVLLRDKPKFEGGLEFSKPGLLFAPQNITNGYIQGTYPAVKVEGGDSFQATIGCEFNATSCYVAYRLDYKIGNVTKTFWTFRERHEEWTYNANISLSPLAGQTVQFILYMSAYGSPTGDRALWGNPVITRKGIVPPPTTVTPGGPTLTPTLTHTPGPVTVTVPPSTCDKAAFVSDVTVRDGTVMQPGQTFTKTWRLRNVGTCPWSTSYQMVFFSGEQMGAPASAAFTQNVAVGQTVDVSVNMTAPTAAGSYRGYWMFKNANGALFGIGTQGNKQWWVDIRVSGPTVTPGGPTKTPTVTVTPGGPTVTPAAGTAYDFVAEACKAKWVSRAASSLPCPGTDGDTTKGFVLVVNTSKLETGATDPRPGLITFPSPQLNNQDGYIQGFYPPFLVQSGDRFRATINCEGGSSLCYAAFRLDYEVNGVIRSLFGPFVEKVDKPARTYDVDVNLSSLAGQNVKFILTVLSWGTATGDRALWVAPRIHRTGGTGVTSAPATGTATVTPTTTTTTTPVTGTPTATVTVTSTPVTPTVATEENTATVTVTPTPTQQ